MKKIVVALVGQPNVGKSHLLNSLSGSNLKVGNFAGVTVEKAQAKLIRDGYEIEIIDLPGSYSLDSFAKDEQVTKEFLLAEEYDIILNVVDSTNLERNLLLSAELLELDKKMVVALNMDDDAQKEGIAIDETTLSVILGTPCVKVSSTKKTNLDTLLDTLLRQVKLEKQSSKLHFSDALEESIGDLAIFLDSRKFSIPAMSSRSVAIGLLKHDKNIYKIAHDDPLFPEVMPVLHEALKKIYIHAESTDVDEIFADERQSFAHGICLEVQKHKKIKNLTATDRIDSVLINKFMGIPIFLFLMWGLFQLTFTLGEMPMSWIESIFAYIGERAGEGITNESVKSLVVDGIIAGSGTVLSFLPNIIILFLGIALLETTGYMSRVAFILDGFFHKFGLHGKSFIPLVTGFGCSVPAYMAARTLKSEKDRLLTLFIIGFMSCGARLPVYVLFAGAFFEPENAGNVLFAIYLTGALLGLIAAKVLSVSVFKGNDEPFVMEMPKYRLPSTRLVWFTVYSKSVMYIKKAGTFILAASILIWFISTYPNDGTIEDEYNAKIAALESNLTVAGSSVADLHTRRVDGDVNQTALLTNEMKLRQMEATYLGMIGRAIEPIFAPLGFDWRMSVATVSGLAAKEVIVSTLGVLYSLGSEVKEDDDGLKEIISREIPFASAVSFVVFVMVYLPCLAATAVFAKEAGSRKYTVYLVLMTFTVAWVLAFLSYHFTGFIGA